MRSLTTHLLVLFCTFVCAQNNKVDSLKLLLAKANHDTTRCLLLKELTKADAANGMEYMNQRLSISESALKNKSLPKEQVLFFKRNVAAPLSSLAVIYISSGDDKKSLEYINRALQTLEEIKDESLIMANVLDNCTFIQQQLGNYIKSTEYLTKGLQIRLKLNDKPGIAKSMSNLGLAYHYRGDIVKALDYLNKSLRLKEELGDWKGTAGDLTNIASIYQEQKEYDKALEYYNKSLKILEKTGNKSDYYANTLNNLGLAYFEIGKFSEAMEYFTRSLKINEMLPDNDYTIANNLNNIGNVYFEQGDLSKAMEHQLSALKLQDNIGDQEGKVFSLKNIGEIYYVQGNMGKAQDFCSRSLKLSKETGNPKIMVSAADIMTKVYKATGNHKMALETYELFIQMLDSIRNEGNKKASIKSQLKYEYDKKAAADSVRVNEEKKVTAAQLQQEKTQRYALYGGLTLVGIFAIFMVNRFQVTNKQKKLIEEQKSVVEKQKLLVEVKQKEVLDSIYYARRIQHALITRESYIHKHLSKLMKK